MYFGISWSTEEPKITKVTYRVSTNILKYLGISWKTLKYLDVH